MANYIYKIQLVKLLSGKRIEILKTGLWYNLKSAGKAYKNLSKKFTLRLIAVPMGENNLPNKDLDVILLDDNYSFKPLKMI